MSDLICAHEIWEPTAFNVVNNCAGLLIDRVSSEIAEVVAPGSRLLSGRCFAPVFAREAGLIRTHQLSGHSPHGTVRDLTYRIRSTERWKSKQRWCGRIRVSITLSLTGCSEVESGDFWEMLFLAKIAVEFEQVRAQRTAIAAELDRPAACLLARGEGWSVTHLICTAGPQDRPFEEQHSQVSIAIVVAGTFQYRASDGCRSGELMTPGSLLFGNAEQCFEYGHEHGIGDRCLSFSYAPDYFEEIAGDLGTVRVERRPRRMCQTRRPAWSNG